MTIMIFIMGSQYSSKFEFDTIVAMFFSIFILHATSQFKDAANDSSKQHFHHKAAFHSLRQTINATKDLKNGRGSRSSQVATPSLALPAGAAEERNVEDGSSPLTPATPITPHDPTSSTRNKSQAGAGAGGVSPSMKIQ